MTARAHLAAPRIVAHGLTFRPAGPAGPTPIRDLTFTVRPGETLLVHGPSGCGKSILLDLIAGHAAHHPDPAYAGTLRIEWDGSDHDTERSATTATDANDNAGNAHPPLPTPDPRVGLLHQEPGDGLLQVDVLTVLRQAHERRCRDVDERPPRADDIDAILTAARSHGALELIGRPTGELSHGERKRVALAALMLQDPKLLLLDEPLAGLDPQGVRLVLEDLARLTQDRTVIIVEHRPEPLRHLIDQELALAPNEPATEAYDAPAITSTTLGTHPTNHETPPLIEAERLTILRNDQILLADAELRLGPGVWGLIGHNGTGKSTLLATLAGLEPPTSGTIRCAGHEVAPRRRTNGRRARETERRMRQDIQIAFQEPREAFLATTVIEELRMPLVRLTDRGPAEAEATTLRHLDAENLTHLAERSPLRLSGGESRRIQLLDNLLIGPKVWLIDEPTHGLDERARRTVRNAIATFAAQGGCVIVATHEPEFLPPVAGWLVLDGTGRLHVTEQETLLTTMGYAIPDKTTTPEVAAR